MTDNIFGTDLVNLHSIQKLIICNRVIGSPKSNQMTCIHGLNSNVIDYVIFDILVKTKL